MKLKTETLTGKALDWAVAKIQGELPLDNTPLGLKEPPGQFSEENIYSPSTNWAIAGPIIEAEKLTLGYFGAPGAKAPCSSRFDDDGKHLNMEFGSTVLQAAMRCFVASRLGPVVDVPEEMLS
jgi:hypothetical protein